MIEKIPTVSVLTTVFNRKAYIADSIRSVIASSFSDWELIVVDDCSSDGSFEIAQGWARCDPRIRCFRNNYNLGDYRNRNRAASIAGGKYIKYLDSDDLIYPYGLGVMVETMERHPNAALGVSSQRPQSVMPYPYYLAPAETFQAEFLGGGILGCGPSGTIIRRDAFEEVGGFHIDRFLGDREMWYRLAMRWPIAVMPPALIWWRRHEGQEISAAGSFIYYLESGFELNMGVLTDPRCPLAHESREQAMRRLRQHHSRKILALALKQRSPRVAWHLFKKSGLSLSELLRGVRSYEQNRQSFSRRLTERNSRETTMVGGGDGILE